MDIDSVAYWLRRRSHLLYKLSKEVLYDIIKNCGYKKVSKDEIIIRQGEVGERGQAIVTVEPQRHHLQYPKLMNDVKRGRQHRFEWKNGVIEKTIKGNTDVCVLGPGQIIGDVELICELPTNIASVSASSKTETFFLSYKNCDRIFVGKVGFTETFSSK
ncbi:hypothetical protein LOTGIDRAFT_161481 [Lottia gigantea]|uniref:Cyclic nucleotide-binding domain-containing protein n=1 Tax=Lottia gigantea TaxID=225164 RepID=V3ZS41_LOTGI|nr:hypothetical protein LOTGIDRAFT_161481 [Lottia gigantea]ESO94263.1 hypothetical protein LOTGIDRAFT_161481 [Lottia gigantea]